MLTTQNLTFVSILAGGTPADERGCQLSENGSAAIATSVNEIGVEFLRRLRNQ